jgi:hypothetical protein
MYLERLGNPPDRDFDERTLRIFSVGKIFEEWVISKVKDSGHKVETQVRLEWPEHDVTGYADALVDDEIVYEIKSKHSAGFNYIPNIQHKKQLWIAMRILNKDDGRLLYISKDDLRTEEFMISIINDRLEDEVLEELEILNMAWRTQAPPEPITDEKDWRYRYCRWHKQCLKFIN